MKYIVTVGEQRLELDRDGDHIQVDGSTVAASVSAVDRTPVHIMRIGTEVHRVVARQGATRGCYTLWVDGYRFEVEALDERSRAIRDLSGATAKAAGPAPLVAPMPGMIVRVTVSVGDVVQRGQSLVVMEAMKMENELRATADAIVKGVRVQPGTAVEKGAVLLELE